MAPPTKILTGLRTYQFSPKSICNNFSSPRNRVVLSFVSNAQPSAPWVLKFSLGMLVLVGRATDTFMEGCGSPRIRQVGWGGLEQVGGKERKSQSPRRAGDEGGGRTVLDSGLQETPFGPQTLGAGAQFCLNTRPQDVCGKAFW